jgi:DNA damage-binding protein 1
VSTHRLQELEDGPWHQPNLEAGSSKIIPVPAPLGGAIVVGESVLTYFNTQQPTRSTQIKANTAVQVGGHSQEHKVTTSCRYAPGHPCRH